MDEKDIIIQNLQEEIISLKNELETTKQHLKKYTAPCKKAYYQKNKEQILEKNKAYNVSPDKRKEYNKQAYLRRKEKIKENENN